MTRSKLSSLLLVAVVAVSAKPAAAQNPAQAQQMLQNNPALLQQLRQRLMTSGLTPDQVRARLRAQGYPESLLDAYLPGGASSDQQIGSTEDVLSAISQLGIADTTDIDLLRCGVDADQLVVPDTLPNGTIDTTQNAKRQAALKANLRAQCLAREDSLTKGLKKSPAEVDS